MNHEMSLHLSRIGWVLVHSVWEGMVIACAAGVGLRMMRRGSAEARYWAGCAAMVGIVVGMVVTFWFLQSAPVERPLRGGVVDHAVLAGAAANVSAVAGARFDAQAWVGYAAAGWIVGVVILAVWHFVGWINLLRWKREGAAVEMVWCEALVKLTGRMRLRAAVSLVGSTRLATPAVVGIVRPIVLIPVALANGLTPMQVQAILAHELAHIRRHDYLINLIQTAIETLLFYHPAVWWISAGAGELL